MLPQWLIFLASASAVVLAGIRLSRDGDTIADRAGLGRGWIGAVLVAGATSLPELTTNVFAVRQGNASLSAGDLFGSNMINMLILAVADLSVRRVRVLTRVAINQALVGALGICLTALGALGIILRDSAVGLNLGWTTLAIGVGYLGGMWLLHQNRSAPPFVPLVEAIEAEKQAPSLPRAALGFTLGTLLLVLSAPFLASSAAALAGQARVSIAFVGVALLAVVTSLPEIVVSFSSIRAGSYDLAVGTLLGSNCFNMAILPVLDIVDGPGALLATFETSIVVSALFAILLMGQVIIEVLNRVERRVWHVEPGPTLLVLTYALGLYLTYRTGH
ncbi:MAG: hypothetical protein HY329_06575 [Chloroflexi bacterium]|nr:hypothetical protein [Chloroflexota bacterium]